jgi:ankyrin repeat protein
MNPRIHHGLFFLGAILSFSAWSGDFPNPEMCKALFQAIIDNSSQLCFRYCYNITPLMGKCQDEQGNTPMHIFARYSLNKKEGKDIFFILKFLAQADIFLENKKRETPLVWAKKYRNPVAIYLFSLTPPKSEINSYSMVEDIRNLDSDFN